MLLLEAIPMEIPREREQQAMFLQLLQGNHLLACILCWNLQTWLWKVDAAVDSSWQVSQHAMYLRGKDDDMKKGMAGETAVTCWKCCFTYSDIKNTYVKGKSNHVTVFSKQMLLLWSPISYGQRNGGLKQKHLNQFPKSFEQEMDNLGFKLLFLYSDEVSMLMLTERLLKPGKSLYSGHAVLCLKLVQASLFSACL